MYYYRFCIKNNLHQTLLLNALKCTIHPQALGLSLPGRLEDIEEKKRLNTKSNLVFSFELVCDICYAAKKYMLPDLVEAGLYIVSVFLY